MVIVLAVTILNGEFTSNDTTIDTTGLQGTIPIGTLLPLSGDLSSDAVAYKVALQLAKSDFNDYLNNKNASWNLELVHEDSGTNPLIALEKLTSLNDKNINLIVGPSSSGELRNIMDYANSNGMLLFSPSSTAPSLAIPNDSVYRLTPDDSKQGPAVAKLLVDHGVNVIIQVARADAWGDGLSVSIDNSFVNRGGTVEQTFSYDPESPEFSVIASVLSETITKQIATHGAENVGVVVIGFSETIYLMQSAVEYGILDDVLWFGTDSVAADTKFINDPVVLEFVDKVKFPSTLVSAEDNDIRADVESRIIKQTNNIPSTYAFSIYDIVWILGLAIEEANSSDVGNITPIIADVASKYNGAVGNAQLNDAGDLDKSNYDIWEIVNEEWLITGTYDSSVDSISYLDMHSNLHQSADGTDSTELKNNIKDIVNDTIAQYDGDLSSVVTLQFGDYYSFVLSGDMDKILVHPNDKAIGVHPVGLNNADIPIDVIIKTLNSGEGLWVDYVYENPATGNEESKRSWLVLHEGYVFGSGYYNPTD